MPDNLTSKRFFASEIIIAFYMLAISAITAVFHNRIPQWKLFLFYHLLIVIFIGLILLAYRKFGGKFWHLLRHWYPLILVMCAYRELFYLVHNVNPVDLDKLFAQWDRWLCNGVNPTVFIEKHVAFPLLTEYLQIVYTLFYFLPGSLGVILYAQKKYGAYRLCMAGILAGFFSSFLGFFVLPAIGPRAEFHNWQILPGVFATEWLNKTVNALELTMRDCFPSGHVEVTVIVIWYSFKYTRKAFPAIFVIGTSLIFATVYLRYHYIVDVIAGIVFAIAVILFVDFFNNWWEKKNGNTQNA